MRVCEARSSAEETTAYKNLWHAHSWPAERVSHLKYARAH